MWLMCTKYFCNLTWIPLCFEFTSCTLKVFAESTLKVFVESFRHWKTKRCKTIHNFVSSSHFLYCTTVTYACVPGTTQRSLAYGSPSCNFCTNNQEYIALVCLVMLWTAVSLMQWVPQHGWYLIAYVMLRCTGMAFLGN